MEHEEGLTFAVDESTFDSAVLRSPKPVLVDFSAVWCGPCRALAPVIESLAIDYGDRLQVATVDVDDNPGLAKRFRIRSVPTVMLVADGEIQQVFVGARPAQEYRDGIDGLLH